MYRYEEESRISQNRKNSSRFEADEGRTSSAEGIFYSVFEKMFSYLMLDVFENNISYTKTFTSLVRSSSISILRNNEVYLKNVPSVTSLFSFQGPGFNKVQAPTAN